ncbi:2-oxo acid dehydrogenase subunit E2 [Conexibacter sp. JD483]|uniref:2-oxo acid dehydrogenase subunit E2 n=1 Tax=unclassified Conexibacter TaxID=2627773 RepID=UPI00271AEFC0|nr:MULTISPECIES: 2-oxo acid dehydrogenase subunit E2 [unclassified Conexibacter]MDO8184124.1 2-oxo acid dehydrogenase subunit E2 [Conexibacter sp. CPCC 205706]MDO8197116.1 2-oxo acid dehydrogenase subunit E2 [Conexibacter sp. CPCC 205762]MDR9367569.1 2-oxo acid dehydrogenase subunit E2 [Conexibacter sp. JD483]
MTPPDAAPPVDAPPAEPAGAFVKASRTQRLIARRMVEAKTTVPEFTVALDVTMDAAIALRGALKREAAAGGGDLPPSLNDMVLRAVALALREHPRVNGSWDDEAGGFRLWEQVNVGFAVAAPESLVVPTVPAADTLSLAEIATATRALATAVRERTIAPAQLAGGTFTVSNLGMLGIRHFEAVINPPQAAILAVGALRPTVVPGPPAAADAPAAIAVATLMTLTLTSDHRIVYGADAAAFLGTVKTLLEAPERL